MIRVVAVLVCLSAFVLGQRNGLLDGVANLSDPVSRRASSADRSGGNSDWIEVKTKSTVTLADTHGAGSICWQQDRWRDLQDLTEWVIGPGSAPSSLIHWTD